MLVTLGRRAEAGDVVDLLVECHARIRHFLGVAHRLPGVGAPPEEVADAAQAVARYFAVALPLQAADEEQSIVPRLHGRHPELDRSLARMCSEHEAHGPLIVRLVTLCDLLVKEPSKVAEVADELEPLVGRLAHHLESHLDHEELEVFPAVRRELGADALAEILAELRARRAPAGG